MKQAKLLKRSNTELLELFRNDIFLSKTIRQIALTLKKPYPKVHHAIGELEASNIITTKSVGRSVVCALKWSNDAMSLLSFLDEQEALSRKIPNMDKILGFKEFLDDIILVTGSYAKGRQTRASDMDLVVITRDNPASRQKLLENLTSLMSPPVHPAAISYKDFTGMLVDKEESYGKEIFRNRLIFRNAKRYYELIKEAVGNGFSG